MRIQGGNTMRKSRYITNWEKAELYKWFAKGMADVGTICYSAVFILGIMDMIFYSAFEVSVAVPFVVALICIGLLLRLGANKLSLYIRSKHFICPVYRIFD